MSDRRLNKLEARVGERDIQAEMLSEFDKLPQEHQDNFLCVLAASKDGRAFTQEQAELLAEMLESASWARILKLETERGHPIVWAALDAVWRSGGSVQFLSKNG